MVTDALLITGELSDIEIKRKKKKRQKYMNMYVHVLEKSKSIFMTVSKF